MKNNRRFVKYVSENMTFIMCFYTCNVFWVGMGSKGYSTGVQIVKRVSENYCIFWDLKIAVRIIMIIIVVCKEAAFLLLLYLYIIYISIYAIYTLYTEKERDWSFCHIQILDWVLCYLLVPIIYKIHAFIYRLFSPQLYFWG